MVSYCLTNKNFVLLLHLMKTAKSLNFNSIGNFTLIWESVTSLGNWHLSKVVFRKRTFTKILKIGTNETQTRMRRRRSRNRLHFFLFFMWTTFCATFFKCWGVHQQPAKLQLKWTLCTKIKPFQQLQGSHLWVQRSFELQRVRPWWLSWWEYGSTFVRTLLHKEKENA